MKTGDFPSATRPYNYFPHARRLYIVLQFSDVVSGWIRTGTGHCKMKTQLSDKKKEI